MTLAQKLKDLRKTFGYQQNSLSERAGMNSAWFYNLENGTNKGMTKKIKGIIAVAKAFDRTVEQLMEGVDE